MYFGIHHTIGDIIQAIIAFTALARCIGTQIISISFCPEAEADSAIPTELEPAAIML